MTLKESLDQVYKITVRDGLITKKITDHKFQNPCWCGCDGSDMRCCHHDKDCNECLKTKQEHKS